MTKFLAQVLLIVITLAVTLGNYWYTFGLWPKSWWSFVGFGFAMILLLLIRETVDKEDE
jgi:4-hydroxybenzoate polyprenyltransferase